ncbi:MAG TPA: glycosyltransferase family 39 protein [Xanthobacteraceae bacterium]|jgi:4-amino-4-deoxy-L-arabinose transferase-like glycosyltransferase|nr:glycosyltransferase family 39 protein [Xanthobacteraceae bacterium]
MDGLSSARQPASGFAAALLANAGARPWAPFWLLAAAHAAIWTILPSALYANLPLDIIEALTYGREWQLGYDKLPPLPWWLVEIAHRAFDSDIAYYALGQLSVLAAFAAVWAFMLRVATPAAAAASILIIDGLHYFNFTSPKFNHDVVQLPFWALAGLSFHGALRTGRPVHWAVLGAALGAAFWAKYFVLILGIPLALFVLIDPRARRCLATPGPYLAIAICLVIISPHLVWLYLNDWLPFAYAEARAKASHGLLDHLTHPGLFALGQLFWLLPALIIALPLFRRPYERDATAADDYDRRILALLAFGPAITLISGSVFTGRGLITMWGYPLWLFLGPWIVVSASSRVDRACLGRLAGVWGTVTALYAASFVADYAVLPYFDHRYRAALFPGEQLAEEISARFHAQTGSPLAYVVGTMWLGGNIGHYSGDQPRTLIDGNPRRAPWIDLRDFAASGGVVVWTAGDLKTLPAAYAALAHDAVVQPPLTLPMRRGNGEVTVGWGIIPAIDRPEDEGDLPAGGDPEANLVEQD